MINYLRKPWGNYQPAEGVSFKPSDSLNGVSDNQADINFNDNLLILSRKNERFCLYPYPKRGSQFALGISNFPTRFGGKPALSDDGELFFESDAEQVSFQLTKEMNNLIARVQELEEALDDPANVWNRLREAWRSAEEEEEEPRISEIVIQASRMRPFLRDLEKKIRKMLRREREKIPLDRVQEMDRASMRWLSKQPGHTLAEKAGSDQRILAIVRNENFDTLENKVLHAYLRLAEREASEWLAEHKRAKETKRYKSVEKLKKVTKTFSSELRRLGVGISDANITVNYVLAQNKNYKEVHQSWLRLLRKRTILDDLWSWQAEILTDFCALAITLSLNELNEAELIAQSPIVWRDTPDHGRWFDQHQPLAIYWLRDTKRVVEVFVRPKESWLAAKTRSTILLRISELDGETEPRNLVVWTAHNLATSNFEKDAIDAARLIGPIRPMDANIKNGLILTPSHGEFIHSTSQSKDKTVDLVAFDPSGISLRLGMKKISGILRSEALGQ